MIKFLKIKHVQTYGFIKKIEFDNININELLDIQLNQLSSRAERWMSKGSRYTIHVILLYQPVISKIAACEESSFFHHLKTMKIQ